MTAASFSPKDWKDFSASGLPSATDTACWFKLSGLVPPTCGLTTYRRLVQAQCQILARDRHTATSQRAAPTDSLAKPVHDSLTTNLSKVGLPFLFHHLPSRPTNHANGSNWATIRTSICRHYAAVFPLPSRIATSDAACYLIRP